MEAPAESPITMSHPARSRRHFLHLACAYSLGLATATAFLWHRSPWNPEASPTAAKSDNTPTVQRSAPSKTNETSANASAEDNLTLSREVIRNSWRVPNQRADGTLNPTEFLRYKIPFPQTLELAKSTGNFLAEIDNLRVRNSSLRTDESGNQYFLMPPFHGEESGILENYRAEVHRILGATRKDLAEAHLEALFNASLLDVYGKREMQLAYEETESKNGTKDYKLTMRSKHDDLELKISYPQATDSVYHTLFNLLMKQHGMAQ